MEDLIMAYSASQLTLNFAPPPPPPPAEDERVILRLRESYELDLVLVRN